MILSASLHLDYGKNWHPSEVKIPTCSSPDSPPAHTWYTDNKLWCIPLMCIARIPSWPSVWSLMAPSEVASITDPNAGVIGILHLIVFLRLLVLLVPDIPAPESIIQLDDWTCALFMVIGTVNMDMSDFSVCSCSTAGSGSRTGVNSKIILGPWVCGVPDDSVVCTVDGVVGLNAGDTLSLPSVFSSTPGIPSKIFWSPSGVRGILFHFRYHVRQSNIQLTCYSYRRNCDKTRLRCSLLNCNYTLQVLQQVATNDYKPNVVVLRKQ